MHHNKIHAFNCVHREDAKSGFPGTVQLRHDEPDIEKAEAACKYHTAPPSYFDKLKKSFRDKIHSVREEESTYDVVQRIR
jgi:hypothetical protein